MTGRLASGVMWDVKTAAYLKKRPGRPFALFAVGWAALMWGDAAKAELYFRRAIGADAEFKPAYIGAICAEILRERYLIASRLLWQYSVKLNLDSDVGRFRVGCAFSACAIYLMKGAEVNTGGKRGEFFFQPFISPKPPAMKTAAASGAGQGDPLTAALDIIKYIELIRKDARRRRPRRGNGAARIAEKRKALAERVCRHPGLLDEFRLFAIDGASADAHCIDFVYDTPSVFTKALLNGLFREKILNGELREPRIILSNLYRDSAGQGIDNVNKWLFLRLSLLAGSASGPGIENASGPKAGNAGGLETEVARGLYRSGWWADPVVCAYVGARASMRV